MSRDTGVSLLKIMLVKLLKDWFDPEGTLRRSRPGGVPVPNRFKPFLPSTAVVLDTVATAEDPINPNDPTILSNVGRGGIKANQARIEALTADPEEEKRKAEAARLQKELDETTEQAEFFRKRGDAISAADKHKLKKLDEKLAELRQKIGG